jgi:hypothetical protein
MTFQKIVLIIATIMLIFMMMIFGYALHNNKDTEKYPPVQGQCPDYWTVEREKDGTSVCINSQNLGESNCQKKMNFQQGAFLGPHGECNKQKWATTCKVTWDGITNATRLC